MDCSCIGSNPKTSQMESTRAGAIPEYALLWPIPLDEIQANPALEGHQNPGWN